jgi:hypothetical protein
MKVIGKYPKSAEALDVIAKLRNASIYSCSSGCLRRGYEVLVRDSEEQSAKQVLATEEVTR